MKRLIDDPQIAADLRAEMQRYASEQAPVNLQRAYLSLQMSLPVAVAAATATSASPAGMFKSAWGSLSSASKLLIVAAIGGTAALGYSTLRGPETAAPASHLQPVAAQPQPAPAPARATSAPDPAPLQQQPPPGAAQATELASAPKAGRNRTDGSSASRREIAQLARIKALLAQDPAAARRLIRAAQREFPSGLLVEEREGLDVIALFSLAETERARKNAARFIARYPHSPLRPKLERLIADASE